MANVYVLSAVPLRTVQLYAHPAHVRLFISTIATFWKEDGGYAVQENTLPRSFRTPSGTSTADWIYGQVLQATSVAGSLTPFLVTVTLYSAL